MGVPSPEDEACQVPVSDSVSTGGGGCWLIGILRVIPDPDTVTVAVLVFGPGLAVAVILKEPLPVRLVGVTCDIVSHGWLLVGIFQVMFEVTFTVVKLPPETGFQVPGVTVNVGAGVWVTVICRDIPGMDTVTVPVRVVVPVLALALTLKEPFPVLFGGCILPKVSHPTLLCICQVRLDTTLNVPAEPALVIFQVFCDMVKTPGCAPCDTWIVRVGAPGADIVTVAVLVYTPVLAVVLSLKEPLPLRFVGVMLDIVSHECELIGLFHTTLDVTVMVVLPPADGEFHVPEGDTVSTMGAAWVTFMVRVVAPGAVTVIVPVRAAKPVLDVVFILNEPMPVRLVGTKFDIVSHEVALLVAFQVLLDVTFIVAWFTAWDGFHTC